MRLVIIANRLPITFEEKNGSLHSNLSPGGLVSALNSFLNSSRKSQLLESFLWFGWPGNITSQSNRTVVKEKLNLISCQPIFIDQDLIHNAYTGFCNQTIWPIFHNFPDKSHYKSNWWESYVQYNNSFAKQVQPLLKKGDLIWIHDYHLMLLPYILKQSMPSISVGFFLHIPFPNPNNFDLLPLDWRFSILSGLGSANLIGFHTNDYRARFLDSAMTSQITNYLVHKNTILLDGIAKTFPISIDFQMFNDPDEKGTTITSNQIRNNFGNRKLVLATARLDYTKGLPETLLSFERFLQDNASWHNRVCLMMLVVPSRLDISHNLELKIRIERLVSQINGRFGNFEWTPIHYQFRSNSIETLKSTYRASDVAMITPLVDGMNLVSKEYVSTRNLGTGVLILSQSAGSVKQLTEAIVVNPYNIEEMSKAIFDALEMSIEEQNRRMFAMQSVIRKHDVVQWGMDFLSQQIKSSQAAG